jgi:integrase
MRKRLTEEAVKRLKPPASGKLTIYDEVLPGLLLVVNAGGSKTWAALHYRKQIAKSGKNAGQAITMPTTSRLGRYPVMGLKEAREAARTFLANPHKANEGGSVEEVVASFMNRHVEANGLRTRYEIQRYFSKYILPAWGQRRFRDIKRSDVTALLDHVEDNHGRRQADVVLGIIRSMMSWFMKRHDDYASPLARGMERGTKTRRSRVLSDQEIKVLWSVTGELGGYGALCQTLLLTGQRRAKVESMTWGDLVDGTWVIATEKREKGNPETLRLPQMALDIIASQPRVHGKDEVFATRGDVSRGKPRLDRRMKALLGEMEPWVIHDLRRTSRSLMARAGVQPHVAERVLGHAIRGVEGIYDRHGYADEKAEALQRLADLVASITKVEVKVAAAA